MENKEIYINGVNVAGCRDYREVEYKEMAICMNYYNHLPKPPKGTEWQYCAGNKNCYYKQLKRLEQENKELKEENERLKKDFSSYEDDIEDWVSDNSILYQYDDRTPDTLEELQACMESTHEQWQKYKQALEEIKAWIKKYQFDANILKHTNEPLKIINDVLNS